MHRRQTASPVQALQHACSSQSRLCREQMKQLLHVYVVRQGFIVHAAAAFPPLPFPLGVSTVVLLLLAVTVMDQQRQVQLVHMATQ